MKEECLGNCSLVSLRSESGKVLKEILPECVLKYGKVMESSQRGFIESISPVCLHSIFYGEVTDVLHI